MSQRYLVFVALVALAVFAVAATADAVVLCAKPKRDGTFSSSVKLREVCRDRETQLDPVTLGLQGLQGVPGPGVAFEFVGFSTVTVDGAVGFQGTRAVCAASEKTGGWIRQTVPPLRSVVHRWSFSAAQPWRLGRPAFGRRLQRLVRPIMPFDKC